MHLFESIKLNLTESGEDIKDIENRIKEINKQLAYIKRRDRVSLAIGSEEEQYDLYSERAKLYAKLKKLKSGDLNEDAWSDNFVINMIFSDYVEWKRKSDGAIINTSFGVFEKGVDPTEYRTEDELKPFEVEVVD